MDAWRKVGSMYDDRRVGPMATRRRLGLTCEADAQPRRQRTYGTETMLAPGDGIPLSATEPLLGSGILDLLGMMKVVVLS